jgi:hypothetical protein
MYYRMRFFSSVVLAFTLFYAHASALTFIYEPVFV